MNLGFPLEKMIFILQKPTLDTAVQVPKSYMFTNHSKSNQFLFGKYLLFNSTILSLTKETI